MTQHITLLIALIFMRMIPLGLCQGMFANLDFENAMVRDLAPGSSEVVPISSALPGWTAIAGSDRFGEAFEVSYVFHNDFSLGTPVPSILGPVSPSQYISDGKFAVWLRGGSLPGRDLSLRQTGLVPANARSILFKVGFQQGPWNITLGGAPLVPIPIVNDGNFILFGADVTAFSGGTSELAFNALSTGTGFGSFFLDSIEFSSVAIPEPGTVTMMLFGAVLLRGISRMRK